MITPINNIFAQDTSNKLSLTESQIANGIQYQGAVVSNQLNGIAKRTDIMIDDLQRTTAFYNNKKLYRKWDLCKLLVFYNGIYGIVTIAYNNIESTSQKPFIENSEISTLEFIYNYNNSTPMLIITTELKWGFLLKEFLNSQYWQIVSMSDNFQKELLRLGGKGFSVVEWKNTKIGFGYLLNKQVKCEIDFNILDYDFLYFFVDYDSTKNEGSGTSDMITPAYLRACKEFKIPYCIASNLVYRPPDGIDNGSFVFADFDLWDLGKNIIYLRGTWYFYQNQFLHIYGIKYL